MARKTDELDEMLVPHDHMIENEDEVQVGKPKKGQSAPKDEPQKPPRQREKEDRKKKESARTVLIVVLCFVLLLGSLIGVGIVMGRRAGVGSESNAVQKAEPAPGRTYFKSNIEPELSAEGVKGRLKEAYYTKDGKLAVTLRLSNGMATEQKLVKLDIRIFNDNDETVAAKTIERFKPACTITANGRVDYYFEIEKKYVKLSDDPLKSLGTTMEIGSQSTGNDKNGQQSDGKGPKDIAPGREYYENTGNIPALSADGVNASVIRARYTNDGSLAVTLSVSNGTPTKQQVSMIDLLINNGAGETIASYKFDSLETPCVVESQAYVEYDVIVDAPYVPLQNDPLSTLSCTVSVSAAGIE